MVLKGRELGFEKRVMRQKSYIKHFFWFCYIYTCSIWDFCLITLFSKPCSLPFNTIIASNSYIPPTFSLENVFLYLFPLFFNYHFLSIINTGKRPPPPPTTTPPTTPPPPLPPPLQLPSRADARFCLGSL